MKGKEGKGKEEKGKGKEGKEENWCASVWLLCFLYIAVLLTS